MRSGKYLQAGVIRCLAALLYISLLGGCSGSSSTGAPIAVRPSITVQPVSATVVAGQAARFSVNAAGSLPLSYQWRRSGANIAGATLNNYATAATTSAESGSAFTVLVSNSLGSVTSAAAILTVHTAPVIPSITTQPANESVTAGKTATFSVVASGTSPLSYQWQKGGAAIAKATAPSYTTPATSTSDNGAAFGVTVKNAAGSVSSDLAKLTVMEVSAPHIITSDLPGGTVRSAYAATLKATDGTTPYRWDVAFGHLPTGLALDATTGVISGTPTSDGTASFTIKLEFPGIGQQRGASTPNRRQNLQGLC
jgi:beta-galactosidase